MGRGSLTDRVADLEARVAELVHLVRRSGDVTARMEAPIPIRWARTVRESSEYVGPTSNTFAIVFLDGTYTRAPGNQTPTWDERQTTSLACVHNVAGAFIPEGTVIPCWWFRGRWWTNWGVSPIAIITIEGTSVSYSAGDETEPFGSCLFKGKVTAIADDGYCDETPYTLGQEVWVLVLDRPGGSSSADPKLIVGDRFIATRVLEEFTIGEGEAADTRPVYAIGKRGGAGSNLKIVTATDDEADTGNCLWPGTVVIGLDPSDEEISFCADPSDISAECWLLVLNSDLGSFSSAKTRLVIGEQYLGFYLGDYFDDDKPVYAIRIENNQIYHVTLDAGIVAGATGTVTLPINGGLAVTARNWSDANYLADDKVTVYQDLTNNQWYAIKSGGSGTMTRLVKTTTNHGPGSTANVNVWNGTPGSETVSTGPIVLSATNKSTSTIPTDTFCLATLTDVADAGNPPDLKWYIIPLNATNESPRLVKTTTNHGPGSTANVNVWVGTPGSETVSTGPIVLSATNRSTLTIPTNTFCLVTPTNVADAGDPPDLKWYIIPLDPAAANQKLVKTTSTIASGSTGTCNVWTPGSPEVITSGPETITGKNRTSASIPSGKFCLATLIGGVWYLEVWEC